MIINYMDAMVEYYYIRFLDKNNIIYHFNNLIKEDLNENDIKKYNKFLDEFIKLYEKLDIADKKKAVFNLLYLNKLIVKYIKNNELDNCIFALKTDYTIISPLEKYYYDKNNKELYLYPSMIKVDKNRKKELLKYFMIPDDE